jgi:hypothetical protein
MTKRGVNIGHWQRANFSNWNAERALKSPHRVGKLAWVAPGFFTNSACINLQRYVFNESWN